MNAATVLTPPFMPGGRSRLALSLRAVVQADPARAALRRHHFLAANRARALDACGQQPPQACRRDSENPRRPDPRARDDGPNGLFVVPVRWACKETFTGAEGGLWRLTTAPPYLLARHVSHYLVPASGFQSLQFRLIENLIGISVEKRTKYQQQYYRDYFSEQDAQTLMASEQGPTLLFMVEVRKRVSPCGRAGRSRLTHARVRCPCPMHPPEMARAHAGPGAGLVQVLDRVHHFRAPHAR